MAEPQPWATHPKEGGTGSLVSKIPCWDRRSGATHQKPPYYFTPEEPEALVAAAPSSDLARAFQ